MNQTSSPQPIVPPEAEGPHLPVELFSQAPDSMREAVPTPTRAPQKIPEWSDDRNYAQHWGINE